MGIDATDGIVSKSSADCTRRSAADAIASAAVSVSCKDAASISKSLETVPTDLAVSSSNGSCCGSGSSLIPCSIRSVLLKVNTVANVKSMLVKMKFQRTINRFR